MIWLRKRLVAWLMPEIDRVQRSYGQADTAAIVARSAFQAGSAALMETARP
jgi:hypothetical protein